jgi:hypothetical protein
VNAGIATLRHRGTPSPVRYEIGATVSEVRLATYSMKPDAASGSSQLVRHDGWATELPVVDDVVDAAVRLLRQRSTAAAHHGAARQPAGSVDDVRTEAATDWRDARHVARR